MAEARSDNASESRPSGTSRADLAELMEEVTVDGMVAGRLLKLSRNTTYKALRSGEIPSVRIGNQYRVPTAKLREMLGIAPETAATLAA